MNAIPPMRRAFQWDLARQVERHDWLLQQLPRYADWGYQELYLHLEDAVEYPRLPEVARPDAYSYRQLEQLVRAADRVGLKVVPIVNLLGHTQYLIKVPALRDLNELRHPDGSPQVTGQICPLHPRTLEVAEKLLRDMAPFCTAGKVHVGLDESFQLGRHPLSGREIEHIGLAAHFAGHVNRLHALTTGLGLRMGMWGDMLYFLPDAIPLLPREVTIYEWYYYGFRRRPRVELFNFAESRLGEELHARGFAVWGCPMNGSARYEPLPHFTDRLGNILSWWRRNARLGNEGLLITSWEPFRLAIELTTVVDAAAASLWLDPNLTDPRAMLERGFARVFGQTTAKRSARIALDSDKYPFGGYPRWQVNERWDTVSRRESLQAYRAAEKHCARRVRQARELPLPLRASVEFRWYLAVRDVFVRLAARSGGGKADPKLKPVLVRYERALNIGRRAVRTMWTLTRDRRVHGANERILANDATRLAAWKHGKTVFGPAWQFCYTVLNARPCLQQVAVEQQQPDGSWRQLQACHTIEFQSQAARPKGKFVREHGAPVEWDGDLHNPPRLRLVLRGVGAVRIHTPELRRGKTTHASRPRAFTLGSPAPCTGLPELNWTQMADARVLHWSANKKAAG